MGRPAIIVMEVNEVSATSLHFSPGNSPREKQMVGRWVKLSSQKSSSIISKRHVQRYHRGHRINIKSLCHFIDQIFLGTRTPFHIVQFYVDRSVRSSLTVLLCHFPNVRIFSFRLKFIKSLCISPDKHPLKIVKPRNV